jgi:hypothetical protein
MAAPDWLAQASHGRFFVSSGTTTDSTELSVFFNTDEFAESVTYTPSGGAGTTIKAIIDYGSGENYRGADALHTEGVMLIQANATYGVETVAVGDTVTIDTESWRVVDAEKIDDGLIWRCLISRINR